MFRDLRIMRCLDLAEYDDIWKDNDSLLHVNEMVNCTWFVSESVNQWVFCRTSEGKHIRSLESFFSWCTISS